MFVTQLMHDHLTLRQQAKIRQKEGEILITHNPDDNEAAHMNLDPEWLQEQIREHIRMPKQPRQDITEGAWRVSATREEENTVVEAEVPASKKTKATGKNLAAMRRQVAEEIGCEQSTLGTPRGFKESLYGKERGSTCVWGGKGKGKGGRKHNGTPTKTPTKKKQQKLDNNEREGWQDPAVLRVLRAEAPSGVRKALDDACKRKYTGKMIHTTTRGVQKGLQGQPKNPRIKIALKAAAKATTTKGEIKKHGHRDKMRWMKEIKLRHPIAVENMEGKWCLQRQIQA